MLRRARIAVALMLGVLCAATILLWLRSNHLWDRLTGPLTSTDSLAVVSYDGQLAFVDIHIHSCRDWPGWDYGPLPSPNRTCPDSVWDGPSWLGFGYLWNEYYHNVPNSLEWTSDKPYREIHFQPAGLSDMSWSHPSTGVIVPLWFVLLTFGGLGAIVLRPPAFGLQFSLRTMMAGMTVASVILAIATWAVRR